jgi:hypothetical protein
MQVKRVSCNAVDKQMRGNTPLTSELESFSRVCSSGMTCASVSSLPRSGASLLTSVAKKERTNSEGSVLRRCAEGMTNSSSAARFMCEHTADKCAAAAPFTCAPTYSRHDSRQHWPDTVKTYSAVLVPPLHRR